MQSRHGQAPESGNIQFFDGGPAARAGGAILQTSRLTANFIFMQNHVYKLIELIGTSTTTIEDAVNNALQRAGATVKNLRWFELVETRGEIDGNKVAHWQVTL